MTGASTLLLIITALAASGIEAYPSQCWSDNSVIDCKDDCLRYLDNVNNNADTLYTVDDLCCTYAETSASDTTVAHAGCIICNADGGNAYCAAGSSYNCITECTTDDCNDPGTLSGASGTCAASSNDSPSSSPTSDTDVNAQGGGSVGDDDDDDDAVCFSGDSTVQLASGATKTMADLEVGDSILSADAAGKLSYSDVAFLPHGANSEAADFVKVTTESGNAVKATPTHLLVSCDGSLVQAKAAACLRTVNGDEAVTSIESFKANGIYSAVTLDNEYLVVDGVVASPFALAHGLVNAYYDLHRMVYKNFPSLLKIPAVVSVNSLLAAGALVAMNAVTASEK